jgi:hypothetical protein
MSLLIIEMAFPLLGPDSLDSQKYESLNREDAKASS